MEVIETNLHKTMDDMSGFATTAAVKRIVEREVENSKHVALIENHQH